ncbi:MAG: hypothetical protein EOP53_09935 [Sphingobacteriales bacterium]|nr:MAG: hypothetical protein EOP53_09935 [Sphingobacteriales bacterium]
MRIKYLVYISISFFSLLINPHIGKAQKNAINFLVGYGPNYTFFDKNPNSRFGSIFYAGWEAEFKKNRKQFYLSPSLLYVENTFITQLQQASYFRTYQDALQLNLAVGFDNKKNGPLKPAFLYMPFTIIYSLAVNLLIKIHKIHL